MRNALVVVALVFVLVGGSLLVSGGRSIAREWQFARDAVPADGRLPPRGRRDIP
jgi:hypothetical protein